MRILPAFLLITLTGGCAKPPAPAAGGRDSTPTSSASALAYLNGLVGRYPHDAGLWDSQPLRTRMTRLLGGDYQAFRDNIATSGPVSEGAGLLYVTGNCASSAKPWGAAIMVADPVRDRLLLMLYTDATGMRVYKDGEIGPLPPEVSKTLTTWDERAKPGKKPAPAKKPEETKG